MTITALFSSTHQEHFYRPFVFNNSSRGLFIFNIFLYWMISSALGWVGEVFGRAAALGVAFIAILAYIFWLALSRDK